IVIDLDCDVDCLVPDDCGDHCDFDYYGHCDRFGYSGDRCDHCGFLAVFVDPVVYDALLALSPVPLFPL
ncbi:hypothetical protein NE546_18720, partial [Neglectibacter timonensis]|uniref:hypothetical protein n=1 Tax=Neglectibacter timonensis TaxID=1776382 RepID=UPI00210B8648